MSEFADQIAKVQNAPPALSPQTPGVLGSRRFSELGLVVGFLLVIASVPVAQTCLDLVRHDRVQFTNVFRYRPTAKNLRQYEETLKEKSWFQQKLRPLVQRLLFITLHDTGAKGVLGRDRWLFYRPDLRYLVEPDRPEIDSSDSKWVLPPASAPHEDSVIRTIARFRDQLQERRITLVVVPVPGKPSVYPDQVTRRAAAALTDFRSPTLKLIESLRAKRVTTVDLFSLFQTERSAAAVRADRQPLWLAQDTHWTPYGARLAAEAVATELRQSNMAPTAGQEFRTQLVPVDRWGDILEMLQIPGLRRSFPLERVACEQVLDPNLGLLVPTASDRPGTYRYPGQKASVLVLGDSFCRIYQYAEPQSLGELSAEAGRGSDGGGEGKKRFLPGSAGFVSQLALALKSPIDAIVSDGGASTDVRRKLSTNPEILEGKKVVVWEFVERDIALGAKGWEDVPLPPKLN
jgi:hypothetical protein